MKSYYFFLVELAEKEGVNLGAIAMAFEGYILSKYVSDNDFGMTFMLKLLFVLKRRIMVDMITEVKHINIEQGEKICCILHYGCRRNLIDCNLPLFFRF